MDVLGNSKKFGQNKKHIMMKRDWSEGNACSFMKFFSASLCPTTQQQM